MLRWELLPSAYPALVLFHPEDLLVAIDFYRSDPHAADRDFLCDLLGSCFVANFRLYLLIHSDCDGCDCWTSSSEEELGDCLAYRDSYAHFSGLEKVPCGSIPAKHGQEVAGPADGKCS